ncbi:MAG: hypothetical protein ACYS3N_20720 [Planctomycetota bacterium]|jgi:hypothetical protein
MIKTLRITTIIAAFLAVGLLAFPVVYGYRGDEEIEKFLKSPSAIEVFKRLKGAKVRTEDQVSPLVKQAALFALIIDPPPAPIPTRKAKTPPVARNERPIPLPRGPVTAKFKLIGTSYYASRPALSLAYIDEPAKGMHWVRQGSSVAHLTIEEVKDGSIIVKDRETTVTLVAERTPKKSLLKSETTSTSTTTLPGASASITSTSSLPVVAGAGQNLVSNVEKKTTALPVGRRRPPQADNSQQDADAVLANFLNKLKAQQAGAGTSEGGSGGAENAALKEAIADFEAMRVPADEAKRLDRLGKELRQVRRNPAGGGGSKVGSRSPQPPPRPSQLPPKPPQSSQRPPTRRPPTRRPPTRSPSKPPK